MKNLLIAITISLLTTGCSIQGGGIYLGKAEVFDHKEVESGCASIQAEDGLINEMVDYAEIFLALTPERHLLTTTTDFVDFGCDWSRLTAPQPDHSGFNVHENQQQHHGY